MRRSLLFIPGNNPGMIQNCDIFNSDAIIFDLEDAVSINEKDSARNLVKSYLLDNKLDMEVIVRINGLDTNFFMDDIRSVVNYVDTILLPKATVDDLVKLDLILTTLKKDTKVIALIESAASLLEANAIAKCKRVDGILFGAEDYTKDLEIKRTKAGLEYPRNVIITVCAANKIDSIDTPFTNVNDEESLYIETEYVKSIGMKAKSCIHPNQVDVVNQVFTPTKEEIEYAYKVILLSKEHSGVFSLDGQMIDEPIIKRAETIIKKAKRWGLYEF